MTWKYQMKIIVLESVWSMGDGFRSGDHVSRHHPDPMRRQTNELTVEHPAD